MAIDYLAIDAGKHWDFESDLLEHSIDGGVILAGVAGVENEPIDRPSLDFRGI